MFTANEFHTAIIQLMHQAGRGEKVGPELDELIAQLEQTRTSHSTSEWRQSIASVRGSLMTHFGSPSASGHVAVPVTDQAEMRRVYFVEAVIFRLARLMDRPA